MLPENLEINLMLLMFGLFLLAIWFEARRALRTLIEDKFDRGNAKVWEADYRMVMARLNARKKLTRMRREAQEHAAQTAQAAVQNQHIADQSIYDRDEFSLHQWRLLQGGARTPMTREGRQ